MRRAVDDGGSQHDDTSYAELGLHRHLRRLEGVDLTIHDGSATPA
jgi:hypothetical protein